MTKPNSLLRQIHLDFHTAEQVGSIAGEFSADKFAETLVDANVNSIILFARCHHGFLYYRGDETILGPVHPGLKRDLLDEQISACQAADIDVQIYTTIQWDGLTAKRHPEWRVMLADGRLEGTPPFEAGFYQKLSLSTPYAEVFKEHVRDILKHHAPNGIYFDFIKPDVCVNPYSVAMMEEKGYDPSRPEDRVQFGIWNCSRYETELSDLVRGVDPKLTVTFNGGHVGMRHRDVASAYDHFELESLPSGGWGYMNFPVTARYARILGPDVVGTTGKFHTSWGDFHSLKNRAALEYETNRMVAYGAGCSIGDQLHPDGQLEPRTYALIGDVYGGLKQKEEWLVGTKPVVDIGVFHTEEILGASSNVFHLPKSMKGIARILTEGGHQFDIIDTAAPIDHYKLLVLPDFIRVDSKLAAKLEAYLVNGGRLLASFESGLKPGEDVFALASWGLAVSSPGPVDDLGQPARGRAYENHDFAQYIKAAAQLSDGVGEDEYPMYIHGLDVTSSGKVETLASFVRPFFDRSFRHFMSHKQAPSSRQSAGGAAFYNGSVIYFPTPIALQYEECAPLWVKRLVLNAVDVLLPDPTLKHYGPSTIEASRLRQDSERREIVHLLHYIPEARGKAFEVLEDVIPIYDVALSLRVDRPVTSVTLQPQNHALDFAEKDGRLHVTVPKVVGHQLVVLADA